MPQPPQLKRSTFVLVQTPEQSLRLAWQVTAQTPAEPQNGAGDQGGWIFGL